MSLKESILNAVSSVRAKEPVTIGGNKVFVFEMTGAERDDYEAAQVELNKTGKGLDNFRSRLLVRVLCDENGTRIFTDADAESLGKLPARELRTAFEKAAKLNALTAEDEKDLSKNS